MLNTPQAFEEDRKAIAGLKYLAVVFLRILFLFIATVLILIAGLRPVGLDKDSDNYEIIIKNPYFDLSDKEPAFWVVLKINELLFSGQVYSFFLLFAFVGVSVKLYSICRVSLFPWLSLFLYAALYYVLHELTQIRAGVASGLFLLGVYDLARGYRYRYFSKLVAAVCFHYSALAMLVVFVLKPKGVNRGFFIALPLVGLVSSQLLPLDRLLGVFVPYLPSLFSHKLKIYLDLMSSGQYTDINIFNFYYSFLLAFYLVLVVLSGRLASVSDVLMLKVLGVMLFCFYFFSPIPVLAFRLSEFLGVVVVVLLANAAVLIKQRWVYFALLGLFAALYFYFVSLGLLNLTALQF